MNGKDLYCDWITSSMQQFGKKTSVLDAYHFLPVGYQNELFREKVVWSYYTFSRLHRNGREINPGFLHACCPGFNGIINLAKWSNGTVSYRIVSWCLKEHSFICQEILTNYRKQMLKAKSGL